MKLRRRLRSNLKSESEAYGYTLSLWGSGALLLQGFEMQAFEVLIFVLGGVIGFGILALAAFRHLLSDADVQEDEDILTGSMVHILASIGTVLISYGLVTAGSGVQLEYLAFIVGINTTFSYNILLLVEEVVYNDLYRLESSVV